MAGATSSCSQQAGQRWPAAIAGALSEEVADGGGHKKVVFGERWQILLVIRAPVVEVGQIFGDRRLNMFWEQVH